MNATATFSTQQPVSLNDEIAQKRILWIIAASGIFLLAVLGAALLLYSPSSHRDQSAITIKNEPAPASQGYAGISSQPDPYALGGQNSVPLPDVTLPGTDAPAQSYADAIAQDTALAKAAEPAAPQPPVISYTTNTTNYYNTGTTIDLNTLKNAEPSPVTPMNKTAADALAAADAQKAQAAAAAPKQSYTPPATPAPAAQPSSGGKIADSYWVQAASFTSIKKANEARQTLAEKQIPAEVFTYDAKGTLYYRVRVGPYTTKSEADYWKGRILELPDFKGSYVTNASAPKN